VKKDEVSIEVSGQELAITGDYADTAAQGTALRCGRPTGRFEYRVTLPGGADLDKITASLADGLVTVTVPEAESVKPRHIEISAG
jgi:HSP20 family protein